MAWCSIHRMDSLRLALLMKRCGRVANYLLLLISIITPVGAAYATPTDELIRVEVFTTTDIHFVEPVAAELGTPWNIILDVYELDGLQIKEAELSKNLTTDPAQSKQILLQRIQDMDEHTRKRMQRSATGLARAMQYGIDRYPAIVFDGQTVIYGVNDINEALMQYQSWQTENKP